jgi:excinuclease UvrABC nuclease subunit
MEILINGQVFSAVAVFLNPVAERAQISQFLKGRAGVYAWVKKINGKAYVGSSINLRKRVADYFKPSLATYDTLVIVRAILKYGLINFQLVI